MIPGHTKFKCDGSFRLIKKLYRKTTVDCVDHIVEVVKRSSTAGLNKAQRCDHGKGFQYLDLNSVLGIFFKKLNGLQKYQHFLFEVWCTQSKATTFLFCGQISDLIIQSRETIKNF